MGISAVKCDGNFCLVPLVTWMLKMQYVLQIHDLVAKILSLFFLNIFCNTKI